MKNQYLRFMLFSLFSFLFSLFSLYARGNQAAEEKYLNEEWILCITAIDQSLLSPARQLAGNVLSRDLVDKLNSVSYRMRISPEYTYYESYAWQQAVSAAAKALSTKHNERSQMLYRGDSDWRYRQNLKKIDVEIEKLAADLAEKEAQKPLIQREPAFKLTQGNISGTYPAPPLAGGERRFCQNQKADAFLTGTIREFHGRYFIQLHLFTLYTNSWVYEDDIIFSLEDAGGAVEEIAARLTAVLAGSKPAAIAIAAEPPEAQILINRNFAGRGTVPARDHPPGPVTIAVSAEGFSSHTEEVQLVAGELANVAVTLSPLQYADVHIDTPGVFGASVYHGSMYMGEAPYILRLPLEQLEYVSVEKKEIGGKVVFTTPSLPTEELKLSIKTKPLLPRGQQRVNKARKLHYWTWGSTWIAGIAAWVTNGVYNSQVAAVNQGGDIAFWERTERLRKIRIGTLITVGAVAACDFFFMIRYMYKSTEDVTPIVKGEKRKK